MKLNYILAILGLISITSNANSTISDIVIADSVKDFSMIQGENRWYYGFYDGDSIRPYTNSDFEEFPKHGINMHGSQEWYIEHFWHENRNWSSLWAIGGHPHARPDHWVVRRWHSSYEGPVQIKGELAKIQTNGGDGTTGYIIIDGKEIWSQELEYNDGEGLDYTVNAYVKVNSLVDFAISPKRNQACDGTTFTAVIKPTAPQNNTAETISNTMEIISVDPPLPAKLKLGEKLHVKIRYDLDDFNSVHIWARPYTNGKKTSDYAAHPSPSYNKSESKTGIAEGWFYFDRPTVVDEIRVNMKDVSDKEMTITKKIDARWISDKNKKDSHLDIPPIIVDTGSLNSPEPVKPKNSGLQEITVGEPFPELEFKDLNEKVINIADLKGKVVLIDFWATWCGPCRAETPNLLSLYKDYKDKGLEILGISLDKNKQRLTDYLEEHKIPWPNYYDGKGWDNEISNRFGVHGIPKILLIDNKGTVRDIGLRGDRIRQAVKEQIK